MQANSLGSNLSDVPFAVHHLLVRRHVVAHQRLRRHDSSWVRYTLRSHPPTLLLLPQNMLEGSSVQYVRAGRTAGEGGERLSHQDHHHDVLGDADSVAACAPKLLTYKFSRSTMVAFSFVAKIAGRMTQHTGFKQAP
jgi:hypothetical protein